MAKLNQENILARLKRRRCPLNGTWKFGKLAEVYTYDYTEIRKLQNNSNQASPKQNPKNKLNITKNTHQNQNHHYISQYALFSYMPLISIFKVTTSSPQKPLWSVSYQKGHCRKIRNTVIFILQMKVKRLKFCNYNRDCLNTPSWRLKK